MPLQSLKSAGVRTPYLGKDVLLVMLANEMAVQEVQVRAFYMLACKEYMLLLHQL